MGFFKKIFKKIKKIFTPKLPEVPEQESGDLVNKDASDAPLPVVYGERKLGGTRVFVSAGTIETSNKYLYICLAMCEGEIESITGIQLNDVAIATVDDSAYDATGQTTFTNNVTAYQIYKGTDTQTASPLLISAGTEWTSAHRLRGVAYIAIRLYWNADKYTGVPVITAIVKGRKVFDPRNSTTAWSDNPVLCMRDYLTNSRYGKGLSSSVIDDVSFSATATACDSTETSYTNGYPIKILTCNAILKSDKKLFENVKQLLVNMRGIMPYSDGKYSLFIDAPVAASYFDLTPDNMLSDLQLVSTSKKEQYNRVKVRFTNKDSNWQSDYAIWPPAGSTEESNFLSQDQGEVMSTDIQLDSVTNFYVARELARIACVTSRLSVFNLEVTGLSECIDIAIGDVVRIEQPSVGWTNVGGSDARQLFRVIGIQLINNGDVDLSLQQYNANIYTWDVGAFVLPTPDTNLPSPYPTPPTNLVATPVGLVGFSGTVDSSIEVTWDASTSAFTTFYDVQWKRSTDNEFANNGYGTSGTDYIINNVEVGVVYNIRVRSVTSAGFKSAFASVNSTGVGDTTAPNPPDNIVVAAGLKSLSLTWAIPIAKDYRHAEIYASATSSGTYELIGIEAGSFTHNGLGYGATVFYKLKSVDFSGNVSAFSAVASGSTANVGSDAFVGGIEGLFSTAGLSLITNEGSSLPTGLGANDEGAMHFLRTDNLLYRWTGTAWTKAVPAVDIDGQLSDSQLSAISAAKLTGTITETQITNNAITTAKIKAGAVDTAQLNAGAITAAKIDTGAITSAKIDAGAITAAKIAGGTITGDKIVANTITGGLLATSGIITQSAQIEDLVVTNSKINYLAVDTLQISGGAVTIPRSGSSNPQTNLTVGAWTQAATTTGVTWTSIFDMPSSINIVATANLLGATGTSQNYHSFFLRVTAYWNNNNSSTVLEEVGASNLAPLSMTMTLNHSFTPAYSQSGINFRIEVKTDTQTKRLGANGLTVLSCMR